MSKIEQIKAMLKENPADSFLQHALALEYIKAGEEELAKKTFVTLLEANPDYVGSYYHLAKLYERQGAEQDAIRVYEQGMAVAQRLGEQHAYSELRSAYEDLTY
ncbi:hypothetical protein PIECOFPK_02618 [Mycovorax composti]|jgi:Tfp pilus assembly protein PilF|uniref:Tetratricopeptide repeat protein n=2 Tax=Chitinophagaceae TaxID=563835 RepID=A0ABZ2ENG1_9BACT